MQLLAPESKSVLIGLILISDFYRFVQAIDKAKMALKGWRDGT